MINPNESALMTLVMTLTMLMIAAAAVFAARFAPGLPLVVAN